MICFLLKMGELLSAIGNAIVMLALLPAHAGFAVHQRHGE